MNRVEFEKPLKEKAIRLLQIRAGGRYSTFEAGQLYEVCLALGMEDSRSGKMGEQEAYWNETVCSCFDEKVARKKLKQLLSPDNKQLIISPPKCEFQVAITENATQYEECSKGIDLLEYGSCKNCKLYSPVVGKVSEEK
jgi:hypothetical protein